MALLEIKGVTKYFDGIAALLDVDLSVDDLEIVGLIGPNGAGKSTMFNIISGFFPPSSGKVKFKGEDIGGLRADQIARKGIGRTFQISTLFMQSTVFNNVYTAFHMRHKQPLWKAILHTTRSRAEEKMLKEKTIEILDFVGLTPYKDKKAENLSSGWQKTLAIAIVLAANPKLLLLDEPVTTLSPERVKMIMKLVTKIRNMGTTVIVIEHNMKAIMDYCDRIAVLAYGKKIAEDLPSEIRTNKDVIKSYLGEVTKVG